MILKGRQIFDHIENEESLPAKIYNKAVIHRRIHPKKEPECLTCQGLFAYLPSGFNQNSIHYSKKETFVSDDSFYVKENNEREKAIARLVFNGQTIKKEKKVKEKRKSRSSFVLKFK